MTRQMLLFAALALAPLSAQDQPRPAQQPMAADYDPTFEVATVKPGDPDIQKYGFTAQGRRFSTNNTSLASIIRWAYGIDRQQLVNSPSWIGSENFDVAGEADGEGQPSKVQWQTMLRKLLVERFKLRFHREQRELSVYVLSPAVSGARLLPAETDGAQGIGSRGLGHLTARNATIADFTLNLQMYVLDRPVIDRTGIGGRWNFMLNWAPDQFQFSSLRSPGDPPPSAADSELPDLFVAIQQQLGLKLEATKAPAEVIVVDHIEKPSDN